jgi:hypothetical protein
MLFGGWPAVTDISNDASRDDFNLLIGEAGHGGLIFLVLIDAAQLPTVDNGHDHGVAWAVLRGESLARGTAGGDEDEFSGTSADCVGSHDMTAGLLALRIEMFDEHELNAFHAGLLSGGHEGANDFAEIHGLLLRSLCAAHGQHFVDTAMRARNDVDSNHFADARSGKTTGFGGGFHGSDVAPDDSGNVTAASFLKTHEFDLGGFDHCVGAFDHRGERPGFE